VSGERRPTRRAVVYVTLIAAALLAAFCFFMMPLIRKKAEYRAHLGSLKKQIEAEQERNHRLRRERRMLENEDPAYLEKYARDNFGWAREKEIVYRLERRK
jgi:cell division protein FtsB